MNLLLIIIILFCTIISKGGDILFSGIDSIMKEMLDHCFGNIFVTDKDGHIVYVNHHSAISLGCSEEELLSMTVDDLVNNEIVDASAALVAMKSKKQTSRYITAQTGVKLLVVSNPMFDDEGNIEIVVTYSLNEALLSDFLKKISEDKQRILNKLNYIDDTLTKNHSIVATSSEMKNVFLSAKKIASSESTVMIYGETGTGKEVLAKYIHDNSPRSNNILIPVNCSAIPTELFESEFFGYEKGSFTGADKNGKVGLFELAAGSTLFLDEIGDLPLSFQSKFLRVLETNDFRKIGGSKIEKANVRIIGATNKNLEELVKKGEFREDLFYRLNVIPLSIPPLRNRLDDIEPLADALLNEYNKKYNFNKIFSAETINLFKSYDWPGNVRELRNVIERMVIISPLDILEPPMVAKNLVSKKMW